MPTTTLRARALSRRSLPLLLAAAVITVVALATAGSAHAGRPYYHLLSAHSGKAVAPAGDARHSGTPLVQVTPAHRGAQHWFVERIVDTPASGGTIRRFRNRHTGLCISAPGTLVGAGLYQGPCDADPAGGDWWHVSSKADLWGERAFTAQNVVSWQCMDLEGWSTVVGAPIDQYGCHGGQNQAFRIQYRGTTG